MPVAALSALAIGGASIGSAMIGSNAAKEASSIQARSAQNSLDFQKQVYDQNQTNLKPYMDAGAGATYKLSSLTGANGKPPDFSQFYTSPDYQFRQQQGELGIERGANARGMNLSGGTLKDLASFNSGLASTEYGNYYSRLMQLSQLGGNSAAGLSNTNANMANTIGNSTQAVGQAQASGVVGSANATMGAINGGISNSLLAASLGKGMNPSSYQMNVPGFNPIAGVSGQ